MTGDAYARAGVSQDEADAAVAALVAALAARPGAPSRQVLASGHYANVVRIDDRTGIALTTDGVGTKLLVAEQLGRWDTVGIDCVAMNVNDVICVGAEPLAMLDYLAVDRADRAVAAQIGEGLARGAELAGIEIVGGELAQLGEIVNGLDLAGACFGMVALDSLVTGSAIEPGDPVIGLPSSGLHSNGYTLARTALAEIPLDDERLGRPLGEVLLEPTEIYVKPVLELLRSPVEVRGLAHITSGGLGNLLRLETEAGFEIDDPLPVPPIFELIQELGEVTDEEMREVFNLGCGFCCLVAAGDEAAALELLARPLPECEADRPRDCRHGAPFHLESPYHAPVADVNDARAERPGLDQLQVDPLVQGREVGRAPAQDDRTDEEPVLVDEAQLDEGGGQAGAADGQVISRFLLQPGDLFGGVVPDQPGIALDLLEGLREHDLRRLLPDAGELELIVRGRRLLFGRLPVAHHLVQPPSVEIAHPSPAVCWLWNRCSSSSGADQSMSPSAQR